MDVGDAESLFQKKVHVPEDSANVANLVELLEFMPLAIVQAAAYITQSTAMLRTAVYQKVPEK